MEQEKIEIIKPKTDKLDYSYKVLSNGLKVLLISDSDAHKSAAALAVNIGSLVDKKDEQGLAHFCEHLLMMGSKKYPKEDYLREYLSKNGGMMNAATSNDRTIFFFDATNAGFETALDIFCNYFIEPTFNEGSVEREIKAVDNEFSNNINNDGRRVLQITCSEMNKESPFNHFSTGNLKTLSHPDIRNRLLNYYKKYYTSEIMHLCIYSNKPNEEMFKLVEGLFSLIPKLENFKMPRYDEVQPYDKNNLKYLYKVIPIKDANEIQLEWYLPYCDDYRSKPLSFLSDIIGHEGPNTLASSLNKDNLCNSLVAGSSSYSKTYMRFYISISLTKKGLENYKEIILRCLKCIKDMQKIKINKRFYEETKEIRKMEFDYSEKLSPISSVRNYVANLIEYKPEDVISGILFGDFNEDLIKKYLDMLTLDNLNIFFISNLFEKECNLTEEIYGTKYCKEKLNITEEEINSYKCKYIFDYPPENDFIPKNFDLLPPPEKINKYPEKIMSAKSIEVWYLQDTVFNKPKVLALSQFKTPENLCDFSEIKNRIISILLDSILTTELGEFLYMAESASVNVEFSLDSNKSYIIFQGFNDSFKKGMKTIFELIQNLDINTQRCRETLEIQQKDILRRAKNIYLNRNYQVNLEYLKDLVNYNYRSPKDIINFFNEGKKITIEDVILYKNALFKNSKIKWLIQGNVTKKEALEIVEETNKILDIDINTERTGKFLLSRPIVINKNNNYIFRTKSHNPKEDSSSLISLYQTDILNDKDFQYLKILNSFLKEKFFDQLRTKETLGYIVILTAIESTGYFSLANIVQSNSKTPEFCAKRVRNFYKESYKNVKEISEEEFKLQVDAQMNILNKKDSSLTEVFYRNWGEISSNTYKFDLKEKYKQSLLLCNKEEFIKFYEKYFINEVAILDNEYLSEGHYEQNEKEMKETTILEGENIKKRIICDTIDDFKACNKIGVVYNNPLYMSINEE